MEVQRLGVRARIEVQHPRECFVAHVWVRRDLVSVKILLYPSLGRVMYSSPGLPGMPSQVVALRGHAARGETSFCGHQQASPDDERQTGKGEGVGFHVTTFFYGAVACGLVSSSWRSETRESARRQLGRPFPLCRSLFCLATMLWSKLGSLSAGGRAALDLRVIARFCDLKRLTIGPHGIYYRS